MGDSKMREWLDSLEAQPNVGDDGRIREDVMRARRAALVREVEGMDRFIEVLERTNWDPFAAEALMATGVR